MTSQLDGRARGVSSASHEAAEFYRKLTPPQDFGVIGTESYKNDELAYELSKHPMSTPRRVKVVVAGAGFSGLTFAHAVSTGKLENVDLEIFEKNSNIGGTWFENRYPGYVTSLCLVHFSTNNLKIPVSKLTLGN